MGAWGTRIYEDDTALDIRDDFKDQLAAGASVKDIEEAIECDYSLDDPRNDDVMWLALCCVELETGTLTEKVKKAALEVIESNRSYDLWVEEAGKETAALRKRELTLIRKYIESYDSKPVKRKSWLALQKEDAEERAMPEPEPAGTTKLDDLSWHTAGIDETVDPDDLIELAGGHIFCMAYWLITRGYFNAENEATRSQVEAYRAGKVMLMHFFLDQMDGKLFDVDATPQVRDFVVSYYASPKKYLTDYSTIVLRGRNIYSVKPTRQDVEKLAKLIDKRLQQYIEHPYKPDAYEWTGGFRDRLHVLPLKFWGYALLSIVCFGLAILCQVYLARHR